MRTVLSAVLGNFTITLLVIGLVCSGFAIARLPAPRKRADEYEALLRPAVGIALLWLAYRATPRATTATARTYWPRD